MKLVTISCFAASGLGKQTRFDSDSKPMAIDDCSSRCLTNSIRLHARHDNEM
jgi:hypothetical protein